MNKPVKTIPCEHGVVIKVYQDTDAQSPNDYDGESVFLWSDDRDLCLIERKNGLSTGRVNGVSKGDLMCDGIGGPTEYAVFPVGIGYRGDCLNRLDSDISGDADAIERGTAFILVCRNDFPPDHDLRAAAQACFDEWNTYLSGDVYGYVIEDAEGEELASLWCLYGLDYATEQAKEAAESHMPVARGRALLKKAADDVQRMVATADDIERGRDRARVAACRVAWDVTQCVSATVANRNISDLDATFIAMNKAIRDGIRDAATTLNGSVPAAMVYAAWLDRYWPGD